jgi:hypothetical protein
MLTVCSLIKVADHLVSVDEFTGPVPDEDYIDGAIELSTGRMQLLTRGTVDLVVLLWTSLIQGLEEIAAGRPFSTFYPDKIVEIALRPQGDHVVIQVDDFSTIVAELVPRAELYRTMVPAARLFFERLRPLVTHSQGVFDEYLTRLADLEAQ